MRNSATTVVLFADMNGSGSRDVVWFDGGRARFLELFPTRPNLLSRIENGIGFVQEIEYGTSVRQQWRDQASNPWQYRLPMPNNVVVRTDVWNALTATEDGGVHEISEISYRDGYYDGVDRAFRGYARSEKIETSETGVDGEIAGLTIAEYEVGASDRYRHGLLLRMARFGGSTGAWSPITEERNTYEDCALAEVPASGLRLPVRWICRTASDRIAQEGAPEAEWATVRSEMAYDGYGNVTREVAHGVAHRGSPEAPIACDACGDGVTGPCGAQCLGDERITTTTYVVPGTATSGAWILGAAIRRTTTGSDGALVSETITRYDGPDYVGLPEGQLTRGAATSVRTRASETEWIDALRVRRDAHGNTLESIQPEGSLEITDAHRSVQVYDDDGLRPVRTERLFRDRAGNPLALRREYVWHSTFLEPASATDWMLVRGGEVVSARHVRRYEYDAFGRPTRMYLPGDADGTPTEEYSYELASPVSRVVVRTRSQRGGAQDLEEVRCVDGQGREVQRRTRLSAGSYQVSGFQTFNRRGSPVRVYDDFVSPSAACDMSEPTSVPAETYAYDGAGRLVQQTIPDGDAYDTASVVRAEYRPLAIARYDAEDGDPESPHADTPLVERYDGLERLVSITRSLADGTEGTVRLAYDELGRLESVTSPDGLVHRQVHDLVGRVVSASDPDRGTSRYEYDAGGNAVARVDARGVRTVAEYDALDRVIAQYDAGDDEGTRVELTYDDDAACTDCTHGAGRLVSVRYPLGDLGTGLEQLGYDDRGHVVLEARTFEGHRYVTEHAYDAIGRVLRTTLPGGVELERTYDGHGRVTSIAGVVDAFTYDGRGGLANVMCANGTRTERSYDDAGRIDAIATIGSGRVLQGVTIARDRVGNPIAITDTSEPETARPSLSTRFSYDAWFRLTSATFGAPDAPEETVSMTYDLGDRVTSIVSSLGASSRAHVGDLEYDATHPNAVRRAGDREYAYDEAGNVTRRGSVSLSWDHHGRLASASDDGMLRGRFYYGAASRRVARAEDGGVTFYLHEQAEVRDGVVYVYPRFGSWRLARIRSTAIQADVLSDVAPLTASDGEIHASDAWVAHATEAGIVDGAPEASAPMRLLRGAARRLLTLDGGDRAFLHSDAMGSITLSTDAEGVQTGETLFYPSGEVRHASGFTDEHGFSGQEEDESTGLLAFQFRHLDTDVGRWTQPDPAFATLDPSSAQRLGESTGAYAYVGNRWASEIDPTGLAGMSLHAASRVANAETASPTRLRRAWGAISRAAAATWEFGSRVVNAISKAHTNFRRDHPYLYIAARVGIAVGVAALLGSTGVGLVVAGGMALGFQLGRHAVRRMIASSPVGRAQMARAHRWWTGLDRTWGGWLGKKALQGAFLAGSVAAFMWGGSLGPAGPVTFDVSDVVTSGSLLQTSIEDGIQDVATHEYAQGGLTALLANQADIDRPTDVFRPWMGQRTF